MILIDFKQFEEQSSQHAIVLYCFYLGTVIVINIFDLCNFVTSLYPTLFSKKSWDSFELICAVSYPLNLFTD